MFLMLYRVFPFFIFGFDHGLSALMGERWYRRRGISPLRFLAAGMILFYAGCSLRVSSWRRRWRCKLAGWE
jgi:hypothetical protein